MGFDHNDFVFGPWLKNSTFSYVWSSVHNVIISPVFIELLYILYPIFSHIYVLP